MDENQPRPRRPVTQRKKTAVSPDSSIVFLAEITLSNLSASKNINRCVPASYCYKRVLQRIRNRPFPDHAFVNDVFIILVHFDRHLPNGWPNPVEALRETDGTRRRRTEIQTSTYDDTLVPMRETGTCFYGTVTSARSPAFTVTGVSVLTLSSPRIATKT